MKKFIAFCSIVALFLGFASLRAQNGNGNYPPSQAERQELFDMIDRAGKLQTDGNQLDAKLHSLYALLSNPSQGNGVQTQVNDRIQDSRSLLSDMTTNSQELLRTNNPLVTRITYNDIATAYNECLAISGSFEGWLGGRGNSSPEVLVDLRRRVGSLCVLSGTIRHSLQDSFAGGH